MWRLVKEGLRFYNRTLLISWGFGVGIFLLVITVLAIVGNVHDRGELPGIVVQIPLPILIASMVAGFIVTGSERAESRVRMHVMLPLSIGEVALARVLLPAVLMLLGLAVAHIAFGALLAFEPAPYQWGRHLNVDFIGLQLLLWIQVALVIREAIELKVAGRWRAAVGSVVLLAAAIALVALVVLGVHQSQAPRVATVAVVDAGLMAFSFSLFVRRSQFTK